MNAWMQSVSVWLADYYLAATAVLLAAVIAARLAQQPVKRMTVAWGATIVLLLLLAASPLRGTIVATIAWPSQSEVSVAVNNPVTRQEMMQPNDASSLSLDGADAETARSTHRIALLPAVHHREQATVLPRASAASAAIPAPAEQAARFGVVQWIMVVFLCGALSIATWLAVGECRLWWLRRGAVAAPEAVEQQLRRLVGADRRAPAVLVCERLGASAFGLWRPTIVLPPTALEPQEACALQALLAHEWAHIRRGDLWLQCCGRWLLLLLYAHPLYWLFRRDILRSQELVADACATRRCGRVAYAEGLLALAKRQSRPIQFGGALGVVRRADELTQRIAVLLDEEVELALRTPRVWWVGVCTSSMLLLTLFTLVVLRPVPSAAAVEPPAPAAATEPRFAETEGASAEAELSEAPSAASVEISTEEVEIAGVCLDESGAPLADIQLRLFQVSSNQDHPQERLPTRSDVDGRFTFTSKVGSFEWRTGQTQLTIVGQADGRATVIRTVRSDTNMPVSLTIGPAATLRGRVLNEQSEPVVGATLSTHWLLAKVTPHIRGAVTDEEGRFVVSDLAAWDAETAKRNRTIENLEQWAGGSVAVVADGYASQTFEYDRVPAEIEIVLQKPARLTGQVVSDQDGKPVSGVRLHISGQNPKLNYYGQTDEQGRYSIERFPAGTWQLEATAVDWPTHVRRNLALEVGDNTLDLRLEQGGFVNGRLVDLPTGKPIRSSYPDALIVVSRTSPDSPTAGSHTVAVAEDGTFTLPVPTGPSTLAMQRIRIADGVTTSEGIVQFLDDDGSTSQTRTVGVKQGETAEVMFRVIRHAAWQDEILRMAEGIEPPSEATTRELQTEKAAAAAVTALDGELTREVIDGQSRVVGVAMILGPKEEPSPTQSDVLAYVSQLPRLRTLMLRRGQFSDGSLSLLQKCSRLEELALYEAWGMTQAGVEQVVAIPSLKRVLLMGAQQLDDRAIESFARIDDLEILSIEGGRFTDAGLLPLQKLTRLKALDLMPVEGGLTDEGLRHLSKLENLEHLALDKADITDEGLKHLQDLKKLTEIHLVGSRVTPAGKLELQKLLPAVNVHLWPSLSD